MILLESSERSQVGQVMAKLELDKLKGSFTGPLVVSFDDDGRLMTLQEPFGYVGADQLQWPVPKGAKTDGASIPRALWTVVGSPFTDKYRKPAVVHDYYCDVRSHPWKAVHRMFFEGMITAGVGELDAKILYAGVLFGGPRWNEQAIHNTRISIGPGLLGPGGSASFLGLVGPSFAGFDFSLGDKKKTKIVAEPAPELTEDRLKGLIDELSAKDLDIGAVEMLAEESRSQALL